MGQSGAYARQRYSQLTSNLISLGLADIPQLRTGGTPLGFVPVVAIIMSADNKSAVLDIESAVRDEVAALGGASVTANNLSANKIHALDGKMEWLQAEREGATYGDYIDLLKNAASNVVSSL